MSDFERYCKTKGVTIACHPKLPELTKDEKGWEHYAYTVVLTYQGRTMATPYKCGSGHASKNVYPGEPPLPVHPSAADVLHSLLNDSDALELPFEEWASGLGYDTDSRKALDTYLACQRSGRNVQRLLGVDFRDFLAASQEH